MNIPKALEAVSPTPTPTASPLAKTLLRRLHRLRLRVAGRDPSGEADRRERPELGDAALQQQFDQTDCTNPNVRQQLRIAGQTRTSRS